MIQAEWKLSPVRPPVIFRRCPRCNHRKAFESSDKFRVNGHGRRLDVWLIYKCSYCEQTWNCTILSRVSPESIPKPLYQGFMENDEATAWKYAFDRELMKRNGAEMALEFEHVLEGPELVLASLASGETLELSITFEHPMTHLRLDTFIGQRLGLSRRVMESLVASGGLTIEPAGDLQRKLKRPVTIRIDVDAARRATAPAAS